MDVKIAVPDEVAQELLETDVAALPAGSRDSSTTAQLVVEAIGISANVVTVVVALTDLRQVAERFVGWFRRHPAATADGSATKIKITRAGAEVRMISISNAPANLEVTIDELSAGLSDAAGS